MAIVGLRRAQPNLRFGESGNRGRGVMAVEGAGWRGMKPGFYGLLAKI